MWNLACLGAFLLAFLLSYLLVFACRRAAAALGVVDYPSARKVHREPTPLLGGLAIFLSLLLTIGAGVAFARWPGAPEFVRAAAPGIRSVAGKLYGLLAGGLLVVLTGLLDDLAGLRPWQKLSLQVLCGLVIVTVGIRVSFFVPNALYGAAATLLWLVAMMNSFNLLDNMDGLSAGVAFVCGAVLFLFAFHMGQQFVAAVLAVFLGSVGGFLWHNFPPAGIFMGECGSSFLGYFLGATAVLLTFYRYEGTQSFLPLFTPFVVFSVPFFDTLSVVCIRLRRGLPVFKGDKNHLSHRLVNLGMTQRRAVLFIYLLALCTGMGALLLFNLNVYGGLLVILQTVIILGIVWVLESTGSGKNGGTDRCA